MASPQLENGHTRIANELLEALCSYTFPPKASVPPRLVLFVIRKTYGYQKKSDTISLSQFQRGIGEKNRSNVVYWLNYLVQARILVKEKVSNMQVKYGLNKNHDEWLPLVQVMKLVQVRSWGSASDDTETSLAARHTKEIKKYNTKEIASPSATQPFSLKDEIQKLYESTRRDLNLIGWYFEIRKPDIRTKEQFQSALRRHLRAAKELSPFTDDQLDKAWKYVSREYPQWTLETITKQLTK